MDIYDHALDITDFESRTDADGRSLSVTWGELIRRLTHPSRRVHMARSDYGHLTPKQKTDVKDGPGYTAGLFKDGHRSKETLVGRSAITLDIDDRATQKLVDSLVDALEERDLSAVVHETVSWTPERPRCRAVIPLSRNVTPEEYEFLARLCADELVGIDAFDPTTFQPSRFMYYPVLFNDGDFHSFVSSGSRLLDVDGTLAKYPDREDRSTWPYAESENRPADGGNALGDKLPAPDRKGVVGAFCACYTAESAINAFLSDVYEKSDTPNRYTYRKGTAENGLRIYADTGLVKCEDASDPANTGKSENAFDLVRIHRFGRFDREYAGADMRDRPSYKRMCDFAMSLPEVREEMRRRSLDRMADRLADPFAEDDIPPKGEKAEAKEKAQTERKEKAKGTDWLGRLELYKNSDAVVASVANLMLIFDNDPNLKGLVGINVFKGGRKQLLREPPWTHLYDIYGPSWSDMDDKALRNYLNRKYRLTCSNMIEDVLAETSGGIQIHPVKEYIESAEWDEIPRVDSLFVDCLGADDSPYTREVTRKWLVAAVKRIYEPGCKWDYMPVLVGPQGIGKSLLIRKLGGQWTQDTLPDLRQDKASYEALDGYWLVEMGELAGMRKADRDSVKSYITKTSDDFRKAYGHNVETYRRTCVFVGTTNDETFLNDVTGNRRFLPIQCRGERATTHPWKLTDEDVHQIWAEAYRIYLKEGKDLMTFSAETSATAVARQEDASLADEWVSIIRDWLDEPLDRDFYSWPLDRRQRYFRLDGDGIDRRIAKANADNVMYRTKVCIAEIWCECLGRERGAITRTDQIRISQAMMLVDGWEKSASNTSFGPYGKQKYYLRKGRIPGAEK